MTEFEDFRPFFEAMIGEMKRHDPEFGDSWRKTALWVTKNLDEKMAVCFLRYWQTESMDELVDLANLCAMRWLREAQK